MIGKVFIFILLGATWALANPVTPDDRKELHELELILREKYNTLWHKAIKDIEDHKKILINDNEEAKPQNFLSPYDIKVTEQDSESYVQLVKKLRAELETLRQEIIQLQSISQDKSSSNYQLIVLMEKYDKDWQDAMRQLQQHPYYKVSSRSTEMKARTNKILPAEKCHENWNTLPDEWKVKLGHLRQRISALAWSRNAIMDGTQKDALRAHYARDWNLILHELDELINGWKEETVHLANHIVTDGGAATIEAHEALGQLVLKYTAELEYLKKQINELAIKNA